MLPYVHIKEQIGSFSNFLHIHKSFHHILYYRPLHPQRTRGTQSITSKMKAAFVLSSLLLICSISASVIGATKSLNGDPSRVKQCFLCTCGALTGPCYCGFIGGPGCPADGCCDG
ncbi:hypothetical protein BT63DRAFT_130159 [Microthyrium microscopicum]|uniref:Uncharacterized protein n=1 Tax=Microthyrium microscopicum TaxID=703497 RepID=A0A6A6TTM5_9PEZI|nr:hypothetical protein BT63DRAFT_130159 [Microthyrium microscopicum]